MTRVPPVVIDTNVLISSLIGRPATIAPILEALFDQKFHLVTSEELLRELRSVVRRPAILKRLKIDLIDLAEALANIEAEATLVTPTHTIRVCRDPKDNVVLEVALTGSVSAIVSRDEDLLALDPFEEIPILRPGAFLAWLKSH